MATNTADALRSHASGEVFAPPDPGFAEAHAGFNLAEQHQPDLVLRATNEADVAAAVKLGATSGLPVRAQATGHGIGIPMPRGILVSTAGMRSVHINPARRTATVGAGTQWHEVINAAAQHGLAPLSGSSPTVGIVGYTLGGGMGPMARTFGFASDRVRRLRMIDATGRTVEIDAEREPDLFWALRGGKPWVGIVTETEFELVEVPTYYGGSIFFAGDHAERVLHAFAQWAPTVPDAVSTSITLLRLPDLPIFPEPLRGRLSVHLRYVHIGDPAQGAEWLAPMRAAATPVLDLVAVTPAVAIGSVHQDPTEPMPARDDSIRLRELTPATVDSLLEAAGPGVDTPLIMAEVRMMGGALAQAGTHDSAVGGRDGAFNVCVIGPYPPPLREAVDAASAATLGALQPWALTGSLINFQGYALAPDQVRAAWSPEVRGRLDAIERSWDPDHLFQTAFSHARGD
ncbi:FAD-binding oxidoreductase [Leucobacter salsicius]|uniref:FAD-binding oxidoreductase n=1 Tax=Leucobacter salsicius TaxID=664638 RepID=UPI0003491193|nr:FAD-binding oxidoreductase [Leucobacter salsicius]